MSDWKGFRARYHGRCARCLSAIVPGDPIRWSKRHKGQTYHAACYGDGPDAPMPAPTPEPAREPEPQPEPSPAPAQAPSMDLDEVERIADRVSKAGDVRVLNACSVSIAKAKDELGAFVESKLSSTRVLTINVERQDAPTVSIDQAHYMVAKLLRVIASKRHAYLYGPPGSGKSKAAQQVAEALSMEYGYISLNPQTPESRLLGFIDAGGHYRRTVFRDRFEHGGVYCIDEMDNAHPALLNTLNGMVEPGASLGAFPDGVVKRHADFVLIGTGNTNGRGGDVLFPERRALDSAFMERFVFLAWAYDEALEEALTMAHGPQNGKAWLSWCRKARAYCKTHSIRLWITPRASMTGAMFLDTLDWPVREVAEAVVFKGLDHDTAERIVSACPLPTVNA